MLADLKYALRQLRRSPGFALTAILTLALGIGATTSIYSVTYATLLAPLPYPKPGQLVMVGPKLVPPSAQPALPRYAHARAR